MKKKFAFLSVAATIAFLSASAVAQVNVSPNGVSVTAPGGISVGTGGVNLGGLGGVANGIAGGNLGGVAGGLGNLGGVAGGLGNLGGVAGGLGNLGGVAGGLGNLGGVAGGLGGVAGSLGGLGGNLGGLAGGGGLGGIAAAASGVPFGGNAGNAPAQGCCYDYSNESGNRDKIIDTFTKQINAMQLAIIEAMRLGTGQTTGNMREQTTAAHNLADVQDDRRVVGNVEKARLDAISQAASGASTCNVATSASGGSLIKNVEATRTALTQQMTKWATGNGDSPTAQGPDLAVQARIQQHCALYASAADQISGLCQGGGGTQMENADVDISQSMFYADQGGYVGALSQDRFTAAQHFLVNALDPAPDARMVAGSAATAVGREIAGRYASNTARMSVATDTANFLLAQLAPRAGDQTSTSKGAMDVAQWASQTKAQVIGYSDRDYSNGVSWYDFMDLRSRAWFQNPGWMVKMDTNSGEQAQKDATAILSFMAVQNWEQYRLQMRMAMTLATMLAIQVDEIRGRAFTRK